MRCSARLDERGPDSRGGVSGLVDLHFAAVLESHGLLRGGGVAGDGGAAGALLRLRDSSANFIILLDDDVDRI